MTTNYHTAIVAGAAGTAATVNAPLGQLDQIITNVISGAQTIPVPAASVSAGTFGAGAFGLTGTSILTSMLTVSNNGDNSTIDVIAYRESVGTKARLLGRGARGTSGSPAALQSGDVIATFSCRGYHSSGNWGGETGLVVFEADEGFTSTAQGTRIGFFTTAIGSTSNTRRMTIKADGSVGIGTGSPAALLHVVGNVEIDGDINHDGSNVGFYGSAPVAKATVTGSRGGNAALASLLTALANLGLITDSTT